MGRKDLDPAEAAAAAAEGIEEGWREGAAEDGERPVLEDPWKVDPYVWDEDREGGRGWASKGLKVHASKLFDPKPRVPCGRALADEEIPDRHRTRRWLDAKRLFVKEELRVLLREIMSGIAHHADPDGSSAFPGRALLAEWAGVTEDTVSKCVGELEAAGWVRRIMIVSGGEQTGWLYALGVPADLRWDPDALRDPDNPETKGWWVRDGGGDS